MKSTVQIRPERVDDAAAVRAVLEAAFPSDAEAGLVERLRETNAWIPELALVATVDCALVGYLLLTRGVIETADEPVPCLALGPMAVRSKHQRQGIGSMLVQRAINDATQLRYEIIIVLGHPTYYPRFGFAPASTWAIAAPFDVPDEVFMAAWLGSARPCRVNGRMQYAPPFADLAS